MSRPLRSLLAALLCLPLFAAGAPIAQAAMLEGAGWWWRLQTGVLVDMSPPAYVPEGGLYVAGAPDGPLAIAAVRFRLTDDDIDIVLTLDVAEDRGGEAAVLLACRAGSPWTPAQTGRWEDRPDVDCERGEVEGERADDGETWSFHLTALVEDDRLDLVLVPGQLPNAPAGGSASFELAFEPVTAASLSSAPASEEWETAAPPPSDSDDDGDHTVFTPDEDFSGGGQELSPPADHAYEPQPFTTGPQTAPGPGMAEGEHPVPEPEAAGDEEAVDDEPMILEDATPPGAPGEQPVSAEGSSAQGLGLLLIVLCAGAGMLFAGGSQRPPQPLGTFAQRRARPVPAATEVRGIGRFARPREARPPSLL